MDVETYYMIITLNGKAVMFRGDDMYEEDGVYVFTFDDEIVAQFRKEAIAGYCLTEREVYDDEE